MKKVLSVYLTLTILSIGFVQAQSGIGFTVNMNVSRYRIPDGVSSTKGKANAGLTAGIAGDIELMPKYVYLQPQALFSLRSYKSPNGKNIFNFTMVEIPLSFVFKYPIKQAGKVYAGIGANFGIALGGKYKSGTQSRKLIFGGTDQADFKRLDMGLQFLSGFELKNRIFVNVKHTLGLSNIEPNVNLANIKTANWQFGVGYYFY